MRWKDGDSFEGEWKNDEKNGKGILKKANGNYKKGTFKEDVDDKVKYYNKDNKEISQEEYNKKQILFIKKSSKMFKNTLITIVIAGFLAAIIFFSAST